MKRGTTVDILQQRLVTATATIVKSADLGPMIVQKFKGKRIAPRPLSPAAELLFDCVKLIDPHISARKIDTVLEQFEVVERPPDHRAKGKTKTSGS